MTGKVRFQAMEEEEDPHPVVVTPQKKKLSAQRQQRQEAASENKRSNKKNIEMAAAEEGPSPKRGRSFFRLRKHKRDVVDVEDDVPTEDDPVIALFRSRTTQRVRFSMEGPSAAEPESSKKKGGGSPDNNKSSSNSSSSLSIKKFMKGALFGKSGSKGNGSFDEFEADFAKEIETAKRDSEMVWESAEAADGGASVVHTTGLNNRTTGLTVSFAENRETRAAVTKLLNKARRAQFVHYHYEYAVKCYVKALELLTRAKYPDDHPTVVKTMQSLNNAHHALSSYKNSANIVKMGIKYEDTGELVRALKMYTIAYRIRRDNLSRTHPSLVVILNMLGSIQIKRNELEEAMQIYELALKDAPVVYEGEDNNSFQEEIPPPTGNLMARSVTYRDMGTIYEQWGEIDEALRMYHLSLDCVAAYKGISNYHSSQIVTPVKEPVKEVALVKEEKKMQDESFSSSEHEILHNLENVRLSSRTEVVNANSGIGDHGMELFIGSRKKGKRRKGEMITAASNYDVFFPPSLDEKMKKKGWKENKPVAGKTSEDVDVALTIHQIAQLHRADEEYNLALAAYSVSLRGMKYALGKLHPNVAAILGNIGNVQKEMGDMDASFETYQQVLAIESYRLGLSHPDVAITLHNIATIDAARGNHDHALSLYRQVLSLQRKVFGSDDDSVAVTSACMGDVYERVGDLKNATECFEEALRIKTATMGRHSLEVARLLHKLGKLSVLKDDFSLADSYISRTILIYRLNKLAEDDEWVVDANRDAADIDAAIAMGRGSVGKIEL